MKTDQNGPKLSENAIQAAAFMWFRDNYPELRKCLFAVPNGGKRDYKAAGTLKATGVEPGVADMILLFSRRAYCFEFKTKYLGRMSPNQLFFYDQMVKQNIPYYLIDDIDMFKRIIISILNSKQ